MGASDSNYVKRLFIQIADGDESAFRKLFDEYNGKLAVFIFRYTKSDAIASELVQDIFVKVWDKRARLTTVENPDAYLFTMTFNRIMDHLRKVANESKMLKEVWQYIADTQSSVEENLNAKESQQLINQAVVQLSPQKQKIFRLSRYEGLNHEQIAAELHVSKSTVKNHLVETLRHIRTYLHQHTETLFLILFLPFL